MNIPKNLKIGGQVYDVEITDKLVLGIANCSAEILYNDLVIRVSPNKAAKMEADFVHEMIHGIYAHLGYKDHDEKQIEELAQALYAVIVDNPAMFSEIDSIPRESTEGEKDNAEHSNIDGQTCN